MASLVFAGHLRINDLKYIAMKKILLFILPLCICCLTGFYSLEVKKSTKKYLPVYFELTDSTYLKKDLQLWFKMAFKQYQIRVINKDELKDFIAIEVKNTIAPYFESGGKADYEKINQYLAANQHNVANYLKIELYIDKEGILKDSIRWSNTPQPINMEVQTKRVYKSMFADSAHTSSVQQLTQFIADSIVASGVLLKED
jgi:hypothetical protein